MGATLRLLSVRGIPINVHASWILVYALITWSLAVGYFPRALPDLPPAAHWAHGLVAALLLFATVLLHELSHALVARGYGLAVHGITLHVFGGVAHLEDEPPRPGVELAIALAGPLTSFGVAAIAWFGVASAGPRSGSARAVLTYLASINVLVGVFNLIPGFPLDGGRVLRAAVWKWKGSLHAATQIASRIGTAFAIALIVLGVFQIFGGAVIGGAWMVMLGLFLHGASAASYTQTAVRDALGRLTVGDVMTRTVITVPPGETLAQLADRLWAQHFTSFPVVSNGTVEGIVSRQHLLAVPRERWAETRVVDVMGPLADNLVVGRRDSVFRALEKASTNGIGRLAVLEQGRLTGYLALTDIAHILALQGFRHDADAWTETRGARPTTLRRAA
jgi:Zn-dependent protease/predicted transcriptional regulator